MDVDFQESLEILMQFFQVWGERVECVWSRMRIARRAPIEEGPRELQIAGISIPSLKIISLL